MSNSDFDAVREGSVDLSEEFFVRDRGERLRVGAHVAEENQCYDCGLVVFGKYLRVKITADGM